MYFGGLIGSILTLIAFFVALGARKRSIENKDRLRRTEEKLDDLAGEIRWMREEWRGEKKSEGGIFTPDTGGIARPAIARIETSSPPKREAPDEPAQASVPPISAAAGKSASKRHTTPARTRKLRRAARHAVGRLGRRRGARTRRAFPRALYDRSRIAWAGRARRAWCATCRRTCCSWRMVAAWRNHNSHRRVAASPYSEHPHGSRNHRCVRHDLCGARALRFYRANTCVPCAWRGWHRHNAGRCHTRTGTRRPWSCRCDPDAHARLVERAEFLVA